MNYFQKKKLAFMSIVNKVKGFIRTITGALPLTLEGCVDEESIIDYTLYGQSVQDGTPAPEAPVEVESVGEYDETSGKYKIPIKVSGKNLFDIDSATSVSSNGWNKAIVNYTDQTINCNYPIDYDGVTVPCNIETLEVGTYTLSVLAYIPETAPSDYCYLAAHIGDNKIGKYYELEKEVWTRINVSFTVEEQTVFHGIRFQPHSMTWKSNSPRIVAKNVQIEKSGTATDYEPYHEPITTNIYLDEPLGEGQSINYKKDGLPTIPTFKGTSILTADTTIQPSNAEIEYYSNVKE